MGALAIIPARGGSKRIPGKNIKIFIDKPVIAYSIEAAKKTGLFDEIMVSTDDKDIAKIALDLGAKVPFFRSKENSDDFASTTDVIREVLSEYGKRDRFFDYICCIYPAAPLIKTGHLENGFKRLLKGNDLVFPVVRYGYPIWRSLWLDEVDRARLNWPEYQNSRSQDLKPAYHDAGQWYWLKYKPDIQLSFSKKSEVIILSETEVQDIDTPEDWQLAIIKYKLNQKEHDL